MKTPEGSRFSQPIQNQRFVDINHRVSLLDEPEKAGFAKTGLQPQAAKTLRWPQSPPVRGRGLKREPEVELEVDLSSPPVRGRGLKLHHHVVVRDSVPSPPVRGRGLKLAAGHERRPCWACRLPCGGAD